MSCITCMINPLTWFITPNALYRYYKNFVASTRLRPDSMILNIVINRIFAGPINFSIDKYLRYVSWCVFIMKFSHRAFIQLSPLFMCWTGLKNLLVYFITTKASVKSMKAYCVRKQWHILAGCNVLIGSLCFRRLQPPVVLPNLQVSSVQWALIIWNSNCLFMKHNL